MGNLTDLHMGLAPIKPLSQQCHPQNTVKQGTLYITGSLEGLRSRTLHPSCLSYSALASHSNSHWEGGGSPQQLLTSY